MPANAAPRVEYAVAKDSLTSFAGLPFLARLARFVDLGLVLRSRVRVKQRRCGCRDDETLLALILALCTGGGHFSAVDTLAADTAVCRRPSGGTACPRRSTCRSLWTAPASRCRGIPAKGRRGATTGEKQYWLHSVFVGAAWVSARLNEGATDVKGDWREQLETDVAPLLAAGTSVWLRADNAYYCGALAAYCRERGWDYSITVTDSGKMVPVMRMVAAMELADQDWPPLDPERREEAVQVFYQPKGWKEEEVYVVVRQQSEGQQGCWSRATR